MVKPKNLIVIVSDTFRRDHVGCYGNNTIHTENIDRLAKESTIFDKYYAGSHPTVSARADLLTGKWTFTNQVWGPIPSTETLLTEVLAKAGYATYAAVDTPFYMKDGYGYDRGFDVFLESYGQNMFNRGAIIQRIVAQRRFEEDCFAPLTFTKAAHILDRNRGNQKPFFLLVDTWDPHEPWEPPSWYTKLYKPNYDGRFVLPTYSRVTGVVPPDDLETAHACYCGEITMVDRWLGAFMTRVEDMGLKEDTVVVFMTDHGFYFGEHDIFGKALLENIPEQRNQGKDRLEIKWSRSPLYEEITHIPLMIYHPEHSAKRVSSLVSLVDIMPTLLDLLGVEPEPGVQGRSFAPAVTGADFPGRSFTVTSVPLQNPRMTTKMVDSFERGMTDYMPATITTMQWALLYSARGQKNELYNLSKDPKQENNVVAENPDIARELHADYLQLLRSAGTRPELLEPRSEITL